MPAREVTTRARTRWPASLRLAPTAGVSSALATLPPLPRRPDIDAVLDLVVGAYAPDEDEIKAEVEFERVLRSSTDSTSRPDTPGVPDTRDVSHTPDGSGRGASHTRNVSLPPGAPDRPSTLADHTHTHVNPHDTRAASVPFGNAHAPTTPTAVIVTPAARRFRLRVYLLLHLGRGGDARDAVLRRVQELKGITDDGRKNERGSDTGGDVVRTIAVRPASRAPSVGTKRGRRGAKRKRTPDAEPVEAVTTPKKPTVEYKQKPPRRAEQRTNPKEGRVPPCLACRARKVGCDRGQPCERCHRRRKQCVYPGGSKSAKPSTTVLKSLPLAGPSASSSQKSSRRRQNKKAKRSAVNATAQAVVTVKTVTESDSEMSEPPDTDAESSDDGEFRVGGGRKARHRRKKAAVRKAKGKATTAKGSAAKKPRPATAESLEPPKKKRRFFGSVSRNIDGALLRKLGLDPALAEALRGPSRREIQAAHSGDVVRPKPQAAPRPIAPRPVIRRAPRDAVAPPPRKREHVPGSISSSAFTVFMRYICGRPAPTSPPSKGHRPAQRPPVWAQSRQELCEALPYYRAFQSGMYMYRRVAYGYLLDGYPSPRDVWAADGRVIISHGGGQAVRVLDARGRQTVSLAADHSPSDARIATLLRAAARSLPVILLAGEGYDLLPWQLGCAYAVLGWYWVSLAWYEAEPAMPDVEPPPDRDFFHRLKVRFDWVESQGTPWWLQSGAGEWEPPVVSSDLALAQEERVAVSSPKLMPFSELPLANTTNSDTTEHPPSLHRTPSCAVPSNPVHCSPALPTIADDSHGPAQISQANRGVALPSTPDSPSHPITKMSIANLVHACGSAPVPIPSPPLSNPSPPSTSRSSSPLTPPPPEGISKELEDLFLSDQPAPLPNVQIPFDGVYSSPAPQHMRVPGDYLLANFVERVDATANEWRPDGENCGACGERSPQLYAEGWACLVPTCTRFWMLRTEAGTLPIPPGMQLHYTAAFLAPTPTPPHVPVPYDIVPPLPDRDNGGGGTVADEAGSRSLWRGWVCDVCGRANCRYRWEVCECRACGRQVAALTDADIVPAEALRPPEDRDVLGAQTVPSIDLAMTVRRLATPPATVVAYTLPNAGTVYHVLHDGRGAADALWEAYQRAAIHTTEPLFQRRELKANTVKGQLLSQQFAINSGASYKYIVETLSYPFEESPRCVLDALELIKARVAAVLDQHVSFNEILSVMYREGQKMSWHDDGERGLGPVVAALSLGASATMSFRPKTPRLHREIIPASRSVVPRHTQCAPVLDLCLGHGDVVIMAGRAIQYLYDHRVVPQGLRVAATARVIGAE